MTLEAPTPSRRPRIVSIDALRGFIILLMLVDHTRESFYLHAQVSDPMDIQTTETALFLTRLTSHLCAPIFVALTGLSAFLYGNAKGGADAASAFLFKRGLFLIVLEVTVVSFAWSFDPTPDRLFLQVIWAIGWSMIALAGLIRLSRTWLIVLGLAIVLGHNLLDSVRFTPDEWGYTAWTILHHRGYLDLPWGAVARTSYPLLPWIGVIALGYGIGPWFTPATAPEDRRRKLMVTGSVSIALFAVLRAINVYGEPMPWTIGETTLETAMSVLNLTKYPPSATFLLLTLGIGAWVLVALERMPRPALDWLVIFGSAPLFFYILHLYLLNLLNRIAGLAWPKSEGGYVSVPNVLSIWLLAAAVAVPCWFACRWFAHRKRASNAWWMRYL